MNSISIVKGNEARVIVNLTRILATSTEELPLEVSEVKDLRVRLIPRSGASVSLAANVYSENSVIVKVPVLPCGTYSMEVTGERNLMRIASRELCVLRVVYDNSLATVPSGEIDGSKSYDIDMTMVLYTNEVYQVDEEVTEDGKNTPRTSAVYKTIQMYGEAAQQAAEELNVMHENISNLAEDVSDVVESEEERAKAEEERVNAETSRTQAETDRVNEFAELKSASEKATTSANSAASVANSAAEKAEAATTTANENEQARQADEAARVKAETARAKEEAARAKAETSRVEAESARIQAETDRQSAWAAWFENATTGIKALWNTWFDNVKNLWGKLKSDVDNATTLAVEAAENANNSANHPPYVGEDLYWYVWNNSTKTYDKTDKYSKGDGFSITKTFSSVTEMNAYVNPSTATTDNPILKLGDFVLISSDIEDEDNSKLYVVQSVTSDKISYGFLTDMSGARGFTGHTPQLSIGNITTGAAGTLANVSLTENGTDANGNPKYLINFVIPKGDAFTYDDFTDEEIAGLQKPATDAAAVALSVVTDVQSKVDAFMAAWAVQNQMAGMARTNGSSDPSAETLYGDSQVIKDIVRNFRLCTVKNGAVAKIGVAGRMTKATTGETIAVDGSEGDIGLCCLKPLHLLKALGKVNDVETNVCAVGQTPAYWNGIASRQIDAFALAPWGTVNCQLSGDARSQAHTVINDAAVGTYNAPVAIFKKSYKTSGGGYPSQYCSSVASMQNAQAKNTDGVGSENYISGYFEFNEILWTLMMAELGTTAHNQLNLFGCGCTPLDSVSATTFNDAQISGNSGWKIILSDGSAAYQNLWGNEYVRLTSDATAKQTLITGIAGTSYYGVCKCGEAQKVLDAIAAAGLIDKMGDKANIFTFADDGTTIQCISDGSVNVETGDGMTSCKHYYIVRSVPGCLGMGDGVMTAVVNSYTKMEFADGVVVNSTNASLTGCIAICKRSMSVYLGWALPIQGYFVQADGAFYVIRVDADGTQHIDFRCAEKPSDIVGRTDFTYEAAVDSEAGIEKGLSKVVKNVIPVGTNTGWVAKANYGMSLFCYTAFGGGSRSHESAYLWIYPGNNAGAGKRQVHCSVLGCAALTWFSSASCRSAFCCYHAGAGSDYYVGSWSVPYLFTNENN